MRVPASGRGACGIPEARSSGGTASGGTSGVGGVSGSTGGTSDGFEAFAPLEVPVPGFAVGGQRAVVGTNAGLYSVDLTGGAEPVLLAPGEVSIQDVAPHGTDYYAVLDDTVVRGVLASTAAPTPIVVPPDPIEGLAVGDDQFFFSTCALPILEPFAIYAQGHDESEPVRIATDPQVAVCPSLLTVGEGSVWLAEINSSSGVYGFNSISRYRVDGTGSPEVIARGELYPSALFVA